MSPNNLKDPKAVKAAFAKVLNDFTEEELLKMEALASVHAYLSEAQRVMDERNMLRKHLAEQMNVSASCHTQLFRGDRPVNDQHKAKLARIFKLQWEVKAVPLVKSYAKARSMSLPSVQAGVAAEPAARHRRAGATKQRTIVGKGWVWSAGSPAWSLARA